MQVFVLQYERPSTGEVKLLGVYSTDAALKDAIVRFRQNPEQRGLECFTSYIRELDEDHWAGSNTV
jgi:hypothetical protein